jgi:hypothetical protein
VGQGGWLHDRVYRTLTHDIGGVRPPMPVYAGPLPTTSTRSPERRRSPPWVPRAACPPVQLHPTARNADAPHPIPDTRRPLPDVRHPIPDTRHPKLHVACQDRTCGHIRIEYPPGRNARAEACSQPAAALLCQVASVTKAVSQQEPALSRRSLGPAPIAGPCRMAQYGPAA